MVSVTIPPPARRLDKKQLANALSRLRRGDFSVRMAPGLKGVDGEIAEEFNALVEINLRLVQELDRISQNVGEQGQMSQRATLGKRTEALLRQPQSLARALQRQPEEWQKANREPEDKTRLLAVQNVEVEKKNIEVEQARQALEETAGRLALTSKYKTEFLAHMSHELRTPLNSLLILSDQLCTNREGNLSSKQIEFAKTIRSSGQDLLHLINDILDLAKIESGTVSVEVGELRIAELKESIERTFAPIAEHKRLEYAVTVGADVPRAVRTDSLRLQQILKNLLSNAFKFTERGRVSVHIARATSGRTFDNAGLACAENVIAFRVRDTGIGIPTDKQQIVFEAFQQADGSTYRQYGGTGLGLSISREIARLLDGEIRLESAPGSGSTFTLFIPATLTAPERRDSPRGPATTQRLARELAAPVAPVAHEDDRDLLLGDAPAVLAGKRALIVDDDMRNVFAMTCLLERHEMQLVSAESGLAALALLERGEAFDVVLMDIMMPDLDGYETLRRIRAMPDRQALPVLALTAKAMKGDREKCLDAGASDYLAKPVDPQHLLSLLRNWLHR